jgi:hypothetical protein
VRKISPPPGFELRIVQLVASRYIDCAIQFNILDISKTVALIVQLFLVDFEITDLIQLVLLRSNPFENSNEFFFYTSNGFSILGDIAPLCIVGNVLY